MWVRSTLSLFLLFSHAVVEAATSTSDNVSSKLMIQVCCYLLRFDYVPFYLHDTQLRWSLEWKMGDNDAFKKRDVIIVVDLTYIT